MDCLVSPLYRKRKLMAPDEAKEVLGMCVDECKRQATEAANSRDLRGEFMSWSNCAAVLEAAESQEYDLVLRWVRLCPVCLYVLLIDHVGLKVGCTCSAELRAVRPRRS